jgi:hypothetical protein
VANPFDITLKTLVDAHLAEWAAFHAARAGVPTGPVRVLNTDLSATLQADRLLRVDGPLPFVLHLEVESTSHLGLPERLLATTSRPTPPRGCRCIPCWSCCGRRPTPPTTPAPSN